MASVVAWYTWCINITLSLRFNYDICEIGAAVALDKEYSEALLTSGEWISSINDSEFMSVYLPGKQNLAHQP